MRSRVLAHLLGLWPDMPGAGICEIPVDVEGVRAGAEKRRRAAAKNKLSKRKARKMKGKRVRGGKVEKEIKITGCVGCLFYSDVEGEDYCKFYLRWADRGDAEIPEFCRVKIIRVEMREGKQKDE